MLKDVAVIDRHPFPDTSGAAPVDTFFSARYVTASLSVKNLTSPDGGIYLSSAKVTDGQFNLTIEPGIDSASSGTNLKRIFHLGDSDKNEEGQGSLQHIGRETGRHEVQDGELQEGQDRIRK